MSLESLTSKANSLQQVSKKSADEYGKKSDDLVAKINKKMLARTDIEQLIGITNFEMAKDNHSNHTRFMHSVFQNFDAEILVQTILWVYRAYRSRGFHPNYWSAQLNTWTQILKIELTAESYLEILPYYEWMLVNIPEFMNLAEQELKDIDERK